MDFKFRSGHGDFLLMYLPDSNPGSVQARLLESRTLLPANIPPDYVQYISALQFRTLHYSPLFSLWHLTCSTEFPLSGNSNSYLHVAPEDDGALAMCRVGGKTCRRPLGPCIITENNIFIFSYMWVFKARYKKTRSFSHSTWNSTRLLIFLTWKNFF